MFPRHRPSHKPRANAQTDAGILLLRPTGRKPTGFHPLPALPEVLRSPGRPFRRVRQLYILALRTDNRIRSYHCESAWSHPEPRSDPWSRPDSTVMGDRTGSPVGEYVFFFLLLVCCCCWVCFRAACFVWEDARGGEFLLLLLSLGQAACCCLGFWVRGGGACCGAGGGGPLGCGVGRSVGWG